jgi:hypothetical protein
MEYYTVHHRTTSRREIIEEWMKARREEAK